MVKPILSQIVKLLTSLKLAAVSLGALILFTIPATLFPQGLDPSWYRENLGPFWSSLVLGLNYHNYFSSWIFLGAVGIFGINLGACTLKRLLAQRKVKKPFHGPDILHLGLLLLLVSSLVSASGRTEAFLELAPGSELPFSDGTRILIQNARFEAYENGRPKDWITSVKVIPPGNSDGPLHEIKVNQPLEVGGVTLYQYAFDMKTAVILETTLGKIITLSEGQKVPIDEQPVEFVALMKKKDQSGQEGAGIMVGTPPAVLPLVLSPGESGPGFQVKSLGATGYTTLKAGQDPGFLWVIVSFILIGSGFIMIIFKRIKEL